MSGLDSEPSQRNKIFVCDFGCAKYWVTNRHDPNCFEHIPYIDGGKPIVGTVRYIGVNVHRGN